MSTSSKMMRSVASLFVIGAGAASSNAALITFTFAGEIVRLDGNVAFLAGTIPIGTPFSGSYTFESTTPDLFPGEPSYANYGHALTAFELEVGSYHLSGTNGSVNGIRITNDLNGYDSYIAGDQTTSLLTRPVGVGVVFTDSDAEAFLDDLLPNAPFPLDPFDERIMQISSTSSEFFIVGEVTVLAPEPCTLVSLSVGCAFGSLCSRDRKEAHA